MIHLTTIRKQIQNELNLDRRFTRTEKKYIKIWTTQYNYDFEIIGLALQYTTNKRDPNFDYLHCLLSDWYNRDFKARKDIIQWLNSIRKQKQ